MIASSRIAGRKTHLWRWPELSPEQRADGQEDAPPPRWRDRVMRRLTPRTWDRDRTPPLLLCRACQDRKLDLRPLTTASLPDISELSAEPENEDLDELEKRYTVYIRDFSRDEANAAKAVCSLCALLLRCLDATEQEDWLFNMRCVVMLRPRFDRSTNSMKTGKQKKKKQRDARIIHRQQIWVEFQPIEGEVLLELVDVVGVKPTGQRKCAVPTLTDYGLLNQWLADCDSLHSHPDTTPAVLQRMQTVVDGRVFRLINTTTGFVEIATQHLPSYVALSYVWGKPQPNESEKNPPTKGGPISDYAPTIRDAINIARSLGYAWIWVDRLCIDQNSDTEKATLIPRMKDIYAASALTIVAACGDDAQSGLLGCSRDSPRTSPRPLVLGPSVAVLPVTERFENLSSQTVWSKRGWTFQEHVFSRRLLFVFGPEMFFACGERLFRESMGIRPVVENQGSVNRWLFAESGRSDAAALQEMFRRSGGDAGGEERDLMTARQFRNAVEEYSGRSLSFQQDRVAAFAGVVLAAMGPMDPDSEQAFLRHGHPLRFFELLLTWTRSWGVLSVNPPGPTKPPVPSWSWAYTGQAVYVGFSRSERDYDLDCWFRYKHLLNHDILGLPSEYNQLAHLAELPVPEGLMDYEAWIDRARPELEESTTSSISTPIPTSLRLPKFHLLTIVFDARLARYEEGRRAKHILTVPGSTESAEDVDMREHLRLDILDEWHFQPGSEHLFNGEGDSSREQQPFETFAIISGNPFRGAWRGNSWSDEVGYNLHVFLLEPVAGQKDTYSRLGKTRIPNVWIDSYVAKTIRSGRPRWQYIHLV